VLQAGATAIRDGVCAVNRLKG